MAGWKVEVTGLRQLMNALDDIDKKATARIRKEINTVAKAVQVYASGHVDPPLSNWGGWIFSRDGRDLSFNDSAVAAGFKVQRNSYRKRGVSRGYGVDVRQASPAGSIFEVIGDGSGPRTYPPGETFLSNFLGKVGNSKAPRSLLPAYYSAVTPEVKERIANQILEEARKAGLK